MDNMRNMPLFNQQRDLSTILIVKGCLVWGFGCLKSLKMSSFLETQVNVFMEDSNLVNYMRRSVSFSLSSLPPVSGSFFSSPLYKATESIWQISLQVPIMQLFCRGCNRTCIDTFKNNVLKNLQLLSNVKSSTYLAKFVPI